MILEIRTYTIQPGRRDEFVGWFEAEVLPAMEAVGINVVGQFTSVEDDDVFVYLRGFTDAAEQEAQTRAFYESPAWTGGMRDKALALETGYETMVVQSTPESRLH